MLSQNIKQKSNENYVVFSAMDSMDVEDIDITSVNLSFYDPKGNFTKSIDYSFRDTISLELDGQVELIDRGYLFCAVSDVDSMSNIIVVKTDIGGNPLWSWSYGSQMEIAENAAHKVEIANVKDSIYVALATVQADGGQQIGLMGLDAENGDVIWFNSMQIQDGSVNALDHNLTVNSDSTTIIVTGSTDDNQSMFLFEASAFTGDILWSQKYTSESTAAPTIIAEEIVTATDSIIMMTGTIGDKGMVARFDTLGNFMWGFELAEPINTRGLAIDVLENGFVRVAGGMQTGEADIYTPFTFTIGTNGLLLSQQQYPLFSGSYLVDSDIDGTLDNGSIFLGTGIEIDSTDVGPTTPEILLPRLIKTNDLAETECSEDLIVRLDSSLFITDTLLWDLTFIGDGGDTLEVNPVGTNPVVTPILSLRDTTFCPGDPVFFVLDATTTGAIAYRWYDAESPAATLGTDSMFLATELDVQYVAVVEVRDEFCYVMCDTTV